MTYDTIGHPMHATFSTIYVLKHRLTNKVGNMMDISCIPDVEDAGIFDNNVVHVDGVELGEVPWKRNQINGRWLVELEEVRVSAPVVPLPSQATQDLLQRGVR